MNLQGKLILITGGSSGIGKAGALALASAGARIIVQARNEAKLAAAATELMAAGAPEVYTYSTDLTDPDSVRQSAARIMAEVGVPDVVVNSAGAGEWLSLREADMEHFRDTMASPYLATAYTCKAYYEAMRKRGSGHLIIVHSAAGFISFPGGIGYTPARWAMVGLGKSLQADLHYTPIRVSNLYLGKVITPYFENNPLSEDRIPKIIGYISRPLTEAQSGRLIKRLVERPRKNLTRPPMVSISVYLNKFMPGLFRWLFRTTGYRES